MTTGPEPRRAVPPKATLGGGALPGWPDEARGGLPPRPTAPRASIVFGFYLILSLVGFFWHAVDQGVNDVWRVDPDQGLLLLLTTPLLGVLFGIGTVKVFRWLETRMVWLPELHREFRALLGRPSVGELVLLAAASSIGEEVLFRGAMLDAWGIWISSAVFALLHVPPKRVLWPWTLSAFVLGVCLAAMTWWTGNLGAAIAAHFVINVVNLHYITRNEPVMLSRAPVRPATPVEG